MTDLRMITPLTLDPVRIKSGFTTRLGGISLPPFDSLNLGTRTSDSAESVRANYSLLYKYINVEKKNTALMGQVHSAAIRIVDRGGLYNETDGILTATPGVLLGVRTADCVPLILHDPVRNVIGAVHCGWRPIVSEIVERSTELMRSGWGTDPADIKAVLGPSIGPCCYAVGMEVAERFHVSAIREWKGAIRADLRQEILERLVACGLKKSRIELFPDCTACNPVLYFSYRRDGVKSGRMMGYIMLAND